MSDYLSQQPIIPIVKDSFGENCYENTDGKLIPMKACVCGLAYYRRCPVEEHRRRAAWEPYAALKLAGHVKNREEWLAEVRAASGAIQ